MSRRIILPKSSEYLPANTSFAWGKYAQVLALICALVPSVAAQDKIEPQFPARSDTLTVIGKGPFLVREFLIRGSLAIQVEQVWLNESQYSVDYRNGLIQFPDFDPEREYTLIVSYRYIPIDLAAKMRLRRSGRILPVDDPARPRMPRAELERAGVRSAPSNLRSSGSITRGVSTGSGQSVGIESGLRVQVDGEIVEGLFLRAALTDENTPLLPEGTTRQLNDFDRVFIELESKSGTIQLGDFDARIDGGRFAQLSRKQQGVSAVARFSPSDGLFRGATARLLGAVSRGIFRSQSIPAIDRVQGPYRLEGQNGERFIIVIPGSERVYLNGDRLTRGETGDYVIDYETGEITFTPSRIIGVDSRITAEFEYTTSQFTRTMVAADATSTFGTLDNGYDILRIGATILRESDGDEFSDEFGLTAADIENIEMAGDNVAFKRGSIAVVYDPKATFTQYIIEQHITAGGGGDVDTLDVFVAITDTPPVNETVYRVSFTRLGTGQGSYRRTGLSTNGIAFEFVGLLGADYEPIQILPSPILQQLIDFRAQIQPHPAFKITGEWAASINDLNRLSLLDNANNHGNAYEIQAQIEPVDLVVGNRSLFSISGALTRRFRSDTFRTFSRTRSIEFARDWNIRGRSVNATGAIEGASSEIENGARINLGWSDSSIVSFAYSNIELGSSFEGTRASGLFRISKGAATEVSYGVQFIDTIDRSTAQRGSWVRQQARLSHGFFEDKLRPFLSVEIENLEQRDLGSGILIAPSTRFLESRAGMTYSKQRIGIQGEIKHRIEDLIIVPGVRQPFDALTVTTSGTFDPGRQLHLGANVGYRQTRGSSLSDSALPAAQSNGSLLIGLNGRWRTPARGLNVNWFYQAQSERSTVLQEIYILTGQDRGEFIWVDENNDNVAQLEEFIPETTPDEGSYVRSFLPSDDFEEITTAKARVRVEYRPSLGPSIQNVSGLRRFLSGVGLVTLVDLEERSRDPKRLNLYLLRFDTFRSQAHTLNGRIRVRQEISLLRHHPTLSINMVVQEAQSLSELAAGTETVLNRIGKINGRYRFSDEMTAGFSGELNRNRISSQSFSTRNYDILVRRIDPSVSWAVRSGLMVTVNSTVSWRRDRRSDITSTMLQIPVQARLQVRRRLDVLARFEVADVNISDPASGILGFEMTSGRGPGRSTLWKLTVQSNLTEVLSATASYDGRNPSTGRTIHTARFQLSARF